MRKKIHLKIGDFVKIISGFDKNKTGKIQSINRKTGKIIVKGINLKFKHIKSTNTNELKEIEQIEAPIDSSNVKLK